MTLTDPPYIVGFSDCSARILAVDRTDEWLQPACNQVYRILKKDALWVSFYGWNRVDRFMSAWKKTGSLLHSIRLRYRGTISNVIENQLI